MKFKVDKNQIADKLQELVWQSAKKFAKDLKIEDVHLEHPENPEHGDYSSNIALTMFSQIRKKHLRGGGIAAEGGKGHLGGEKKKIKSPLELAELIAKELKNNLTMKQLSNLTIVSPGFINFYLSEKFLVGEMVRILKEKDGFGQTKTFKNKTILLEHTSPDPIKTMHIGHLRNNFLGMSLYQILKFLGTEVTLDCINNDRGTHVSQAMWGYLAFGRRDREIAKEELLKFVIPEGKVKKIAKNFAWREALKAWRKNPSDWFQPQDLKLKPDHFDLRVYSAAAKAVKAVPKIKKQIAQILVAWEKEEKGVRQLWRRIIDWSLEGYGKTYRRIGSRHDYVWHESRLYKGGKELVYEGLKKGIFKKSQGAIVTKLAKYNLPDTVMIKKDGTSLYITFDINLTKQKKQKFPSDLYIWDIGNDQKLYLQQMFSVCEQLGIAKAEELFHLNYGYVYLKGKGKMSSREGTIISADALLDLLKGKAEELREKSQKGKSKLSFDFDEAVGLAALKYALLKTTRAADIYFDINESVSLEGNSGPYLQYTYARCQSLLRKASQGSPVGEQAPYGTCTSEVARHRPRLLRGGGIGERDELTKEELAILRTLYKFPEVIQEAAENFSPNLLCNFLYDLATKFNTFYNKHRILQPTKNPENPDVSSGHGTGTSERPVAEIGRSCQQVSKGTGCQKTRQYRHGNDEVEEFRLALTQATSQVLKSGLKLLGIEPLEKM